jgi:hypothetical protein
MSTDLTPRIAKGCVGFFVSDGNDSTLAAPDADPSDAAPVDAAKAPIVPVPVPVPKKAQAPKGQP